MEVAAAQRIVVIAVALVALTTFEPVGAAPPALRPVFRIVRLDGLGGSNARANSINNAGLAAGYSNLPNDDRRHATVWILGTPFDLDTLGGPNSNIAWPVKNVTGLLAGIAQTSTPEPQEAWSCSAFFGPPFATGFTCRGWHGNSDSRAADAAAERSHCVNNHRQIVGWSENIVVDPACEPPQMFQFRAVIWGPGRHQVHELPLIADDTSSAATAINDNGQVVGISGVCDQAVGRATAKHAVLWSGGRAIEINNIGGGLWNTPMAINQRGDIVGFMGQAGDDPNAPRLRAFLWTTERGTQNLGTLPGDDYSEARGINERRQVVGVSCVDPSLASCRAFFWDDGVMFDLNDLAPRSDGATLINGQDINDLGVITGRAFLPGPPSSRYAFAAIPLFRGRARAETAPLHTPATPAPVRLPIEAIRDLRSPMGPDPARVSSQRAR